jgi:hypothetical protein
LTGICARRRFLFLALVLIFLAFSLAVESILVIVSAGSVARPAASTPSLGLLFMPCGKQTDQGNTRQDTQQAAPRAGCRPIPDHSVEAVGEQMSLHRWRATRIVDKIFFFLNRPRDCILRIINWQ